MFATASHDHFKSLPHNRIMAFSHDHLPNRRMFRAALRLLLFESTPTSAGIAHEWIGRCVGFYRLGLIARRRDVLKKRAKRRRPHYWAIRRCNLLQLIQRSILHEDPYGLHIDHRSGRDRQFATCSPRPAARAHQANCLTLKFSRKMSRLSSSRPLFMLRKNSPLLRSKSSPPRSEKMFSRTTTRA